MATQKELAELYVAVLGRAPDAEGFAYWTNALSQGATLEQINAEWMTNQVEVQTRYEGLNPDQFLSAIYENVLGRMPDAAGLAYWTPCWNPARCLATLSSVPSSRVPRRLPVAPQMLRSSPTGPKSAWSLSI